MPQKTPAGSFFWSFFNPENLIQDQEEVETKSTATKKEALSKKKSS